MAMLAMTILVHFLVLPTLAHCATYKHPKGTILQPRHLAHTKPASSLVWIVHGALYVP